MIIRSHSFRKQILLFLLAVILPSLVLISFTLRMIQQDRELSLKRAAEECHRLAHEIGQQLLVTLENIKIQEVNAAAHESSPPASLSYRNAAVILVGLIEGNHLLLPWEYDPRIKQAHVLLNQGDFAQQIQQAEKEEHAANNYPRAAGLYRKCLEAAKQDVQQCYARILLARALTKSGRMEEAVAQYRRTLESPPGLLDEYGIPLWLYSAKPLIDEKTGLLDIISRLRQELEAGYWLSPSAAYLIQDLTEINLDGTLEDAQQESVKQVKGKLREYIQTMEAILELQADFQGLGLIQSQGNARQNQEPLWVPYGRDPWLISQAPSIQGGDHLLVVVSGQKVLNSPEMKSVASHRYPAEINFVTDITASGESLGPNFRNLKVAFAAGFSETLAERGNSQRFLYIFIVLLVVGVTLFGGYLLWRDIRREVRLAEMRSQFVSSVSHELKTPLTSIRMFAETLRLGRSKDKKSQEEYLETIVNESQRLTRLLNNVLDLSKIEQGKMLYHYEPVALDEVIQSAARTMAYPLSQQGFALHVDRENGLPKVQADRDALEQAILNLLSNAMKYSGEARDIDLSLRREDSQAVIQVKDRGVGIAPSDQKQIFDKFFRGAMPENERRTGTGLGLALAAHIVKAHKGTIEVESAPGQGSTFSIHLPLEQGP